ncbi:HlyD family efflux transporter periplasmic adaptor subunit [Aliikangiella marina]|uniref:HlyD family efflux transporter periplasmic adaptor subunit n=1 Tax=Aliikangiella marina TaxID=1712262 RepID=A0A545T1H2_9GAMM|nr:HlyD family efflux transporter periplasmic adaptor subunit [Aliikangiella marina]TQV71078.1 HlyD family efflux transporter periplasmic adaptor subunit [Aliikangiella marina]
MDIPVVKTKKRIVTPSLKKGLLIGGLLIAVLFSTRFLDVAVPTVNQTDVWISQVKQGEFVREVRGVGVLVPSEIRWIAAASAGRVERILVKPGAYVTNDTVIAELSNPELVSQLQQAIWELDAAEANLLALEAQLQEQTLEQELYVTQAKMALESAKLKEKAERPLAEKNIVSAIDFANTQLSTQQKQTELAIRLKSQKRRADVVEAKLIAERANVRKFKNMVNLFQTQIRALTITADIEGVLQQISVDVGQRINVGGNIARVARPDSLMAELQIQENMVQDLQLDFPVTIDTRNGLVDGLVKRIDPRVQNGNVLIDVELIGKLPKGARPDLSVTGTIIVENIPNTLYIDRPAGTAALSETRLFTLSANQDFAELRKIQLGKASVSSIQVIAGLQDGDAVIVSDMSEFDQHSSIKITQ